MAWSNGVAGILNCRHGWMGGQLEDIFEEEINKQVQIAIEEADVILFVVDASTGVTDLDDQVAAILRRSKKPVILVANKEDIGDARFNIPEFYSLGLGDPVEVSSPMVAAQATSLTR